MENTNCKICGCALNFDIVNIGIKGKKRLKSVSEKREDGLFYSIFESEDVLLLHSKCRASYINDRMVESAMRKLLKTNTDEREEKVNIIFDYQKQCLFCKDDASEDFIRNQLKKTINKRIHVCRVTKPETSFNIFCASLDELDDYSEEVRQRVKDRDLVTLNARYHRLCYIKYLNPEKPTQGKRGRPISEDIQQKMQLVYEYIDNKKKDQFTIEEIRDAINIELPDSQTLKRKILEHYGDNNILSIDVKEKSKVSAAQIKVLCNFFEDNPEVLRGYKRSVKSWIEVQKKWKKITAQLNALGPRKDHKSWAKYLCDKKAKLKRKTIKWRQSSDGKPIMCNTEDFDEIKLRMLQVLHKDASNLQESQDIRTSDLETEDDAIEYENDEMDILPEEISDEKQNLERPDFIKLETNDTPPPDLQSPQIIAEDEFDYFGKNIAQQLRTMPLFIALETQEMLLSILRKQRLKLNEISSSSDPLGKCTD